MSFLYLDHHSTTPVDPRVLEAMLPHFSEAFGNAASRTHRMGLEAREAVDRARAEIAGLIGAGDRDITFTSGATESDNLAIKGVASFYREKGNHIVTAATEHPAVRDTCRTLENQGFDVTCLRVDGRGCVDADDVRRALTSRTILVTLMFANHEIGTLHEVAAVGRITREHGVLFHCDAAQALGKEPIDVEAMGIDLLSLSAHKVYGPKGIGALYVRRRNPRVRLTPLLDGGGHERGLRSGTLNVPGIVGLGKACSIARQELAPERDRLLKLRELLRSRLEANLDGLRINGHPDRRLAGNLNVSFDGISGDSLLKDLRDKLALSLGSACTSAVPEPSHVLRAIGVPHELLFSTVRFGLGRFNSREEIEWAATCVIEAVRRLRNAKRRSPPVSCSP